MKRLRSSTHPQGSPIGRARALLLLVPLVHAIACGGKVVLDHDGGTSGEGGAGGTGGAGGAGSTGSMTTGTGACSLTSTGTNGLNYQVTECIAEVDGKCPNQYQVTMYIVPSIPCSYVVSVDCGPVTAADGMCCYLVTEQGGGCP